jgi:hypothetical protein
MIVSQLQPSYLLTFNLPNVLYSWSSKWTSSNRFILQNSVRIACLLHSNHVLILVYRGLLIDRTTDRPTDRPTAPPTDPPTNKPNQTKPPTKKQKHSWGQALTAFYAASLVPFLSPMNPIHALPPQITFKIHFSKPAVLIYSQIFHVVSFLQAVGPKPRMHFCIPRYVPHAPPISSFLFW